MQRMLLMILKCSALEWQNDNEHEVVAMEGDMAKNNELVFLKQNL